MVAEPTLWSCGHTPQLRRREQSWFHPYHRFWSINKILLRREDNSVAMTAFVKLTFAILMCMQAARAQDFESLTRNCRLQHPERLNECVVGAVKIMQPKFAKGIPELGLPRMDPLKLEDFSLNQADGAVRFSANFRNLSITGVGRFELKYLDINFDAGSVHLGCVVPALNVRGNYDINGRVFELPVEGKGPFIALLEGVVAEGEGFTTVTNNRLQMKKMKFDFKIRNFRSKVENLFGGNEILRSTLEHFLSENTELVLDQVRPTLVSTMDSFLTNVVNVILGQLPSDVSARIPNANSLDKHRARTLRVQAERRNAAATARSRAG
ncbi:protein takeout [Hyalella azteca]|uniref:Protein takeout n=1 Tax=Hyalella azteca TaxID=294128 RepID=A0A8B7ND33_HYAAZ|nr:protein takeout [Hyalella azteca]